MPESKPTGQQRPSREVDPAKRVGPRDLECCCCGEATRGRQWWNRDTGYGVCTACIAYIRSLGETEEQIKQNYGEQGIHWDVDENKELREELGKALKNG